MTTQQPQLLLQRLGRRGDRRGEGARRDPVIGERDHSPPLVTERQPSQPEPVERRGQAGLPTGYREPPRSSTGSSG